MAKRSQKQVRADARALLSRFNLFEVERREFEYEMGRLAQEAGIAEGDLAAALKEWDDIFGSANALETFVAKF
jgi:uncharacterized coiled-coil DUF342 family protein